MCYSVDECSQQFFLSRIHFNNLFSQTESISSIKSFSPKTFLNSFPLQKLKKNSFVLVSLQERNPTSAHGKDANGVSRDQMNWRDTTESTLEPSRLSAVTVTGAFHAVITLRCTWKDTFKLHQSSSKKES